MKKKSILLVTLFCATLTMAIFGLGTEKAYANSWDQQDWGEIGGGGTKGYATPTTFWCPAGWENPQCTNMCGRCWGAGCPLIEIFDPKDGTHCALVSTNSCTPYAPC